MYKALIFSDLHWSTYSSIIRKRGEKYSVRLHKLIDTFNWIEDLAEQYEVDNVISCGDTFDTPSLGAEEITAIQEVNFRNIKHLLLVGNHESNINSLEYSSTKILEKINSKIISNSETIEINDKVNLTFIPYIAGDVPSLGTFIKDKGKKNIVFAHQDIAGLQYGKFTSQVGFEVNDILDNCTIFINGHLHNEQLMNDNRIILVGDTCGQNFNEDAFKYKHLVYLLTIDDNGLITLDPIENPHSFNFYKIKIDSEKDIDILYKLKDYAVVSISCNQEIHEKVTSVVQSLNNISEYRIISYFKDINTEDLSNDFKVEDHFKLFIQFAQDKLESTPALVDELIRLRGGDRDEINV